MKKIHRKKPSISSESVEVMRPIEHVQGNPYQIRLAQHGKEIEVPDRIQLFRTGEFTQVLADGKQKRFKITREMLEKMAENFENNVRGVDLALDFGHKSDEEAAAWFETVELEENGKETELWATLKWTPDGHNAVAAKKYRYISPDFAFNYKDNETGEEYGPTLFGAGLTNRPVIKNMAPAVELTEVKDMAKTKKKISTPKPFMQWTKEELETRLAEETDSEKKEMIEFRIAQLDEIAASEDDEEGDDDEVEEVAEPQKEKTFDEMGLDELRDCSKKMAERIKELEGKVSTQAAEQKTQAKKAQFDAMLSKGKVVEAQRVAFMADDMVKFSELAQPVKLDTKGAEGDSTETDESAQDQVLKLAQEKVKKNLAKNSGDAISMVLSENPKLNERYQKEMEGPGEAVA